jgi:hypothetical protein
MMALTDTQVTCTQMEKRNSGQEGDQEAVAKHTPPIPKAPVPEACTGDCAGLQGHPLYDWVHAGHTGVCVCERVCVRLWYIFDDLCTDQDAMCALQEAAEVFVTESFHKADMARIHAKRNTVHVEDIRFSRFMTPECLWVTPDRVWEKETFTVQQFAPSSAAQQSGAAESTSKSSSLKDGNEAGKKKKKRDSDSNDKHRDKSKKKKNKSGCEKEEGSVAASEAPAAEEKTKAKKKSKPEEADSSNTAEEAAGEAESSSEQEEEEEDDEEEISSNE